MTDEIKRVSLMKPKKDSLSMVSDDTSQYITANELPCITPEHICEEYMPGGESAEIRSFTPIHITDEKTPSKCPAITPVHLRDETVSVTSVSETVKTTQPIVKKTDSAETRSKRNAILRSIAIILGIILALVLIACNLTIDPLTAEEKLIANIIFIVAASGGVCLTIPGFWAFAHALMFGDKDELINGITLIIAGLLLVASKVTFATFGLI